MSFVSQLLIVIGTGWSLLAAIGVNRFDDVFARMHAATKSTTLGLLLVLIGAAVEVGGMDAAKLLLAGGLLFLTAPIGAHLIGRSVHRNAGGAPMHIDIVDELRDAEQSDGQAS